MILGEKAAGFYGKRLIRKVLATACAAEVSRCGPKATDPAKRTLTEIALFDASDSPCRFAELESLRTSSPIVVKLAKKFDN